MARPYSGKFLLEVDRADPEKIGVQLARVCIKAKLPASHVAKVFGVSRMSVHSWFRGQYVRNKNYMKIKKFIELVKLDLKKSRLPADNIKSARDYLDSINKETMNNETRILQQSTT